MDKPSKSALITIRRAIDDPAAATGGYRNDPADQGLALHDWQIEKIRLGIADAREGKIADADEVFDSIAAKYGWSR